MAARTRKASRAARAKRPERKAPTGFIGRPVRDGLDTLWQTPPELVERVAGYFGGAIPLDVCTTPENPCGAEEFFVEADDALSQPWGPHAWCNPPYGKALTQGGWLAKMEQEGRRGCELVALLSCARWEQHPMQRALAAASHLCLIRKRVDFYRDGEPVSGNTYANMFIGWNTGYRRWRAAFSDVGLCLEISSLGDPPEHGIKMRRARRARS